MKLVIYSKDPNIKPEIITLPRRRRSLYEHILSFTRKSYRISNNKIYINYDDDTSKDDICYILYRSVIGLKKKKRWPIFESYIIDNPRMASDYANVYLGERWLEAEPCIMQDSGAASTYAQFVLKRRWPEAEPYIGKSPVNWWFYTQALNMAYYKVKT